MTGQPLAGRLVAVKEIIARRHEELTANTAVPLPEAWRWPSADAAVIATLRAAGAEIGPATITHEFAWGITTAQPDRTTVPNPARPGRVTGGSSGGAAAAVASGAAWIAVGTDTGGSVRIPADWCGVAGWKPSQGRISCDGVLPLAPSLDHVGFLARTAEQLGEVAAVFGIDMASPAALVGRRVAVAGDDGIADRHSRTAVEALVDRLAAAGLRRVPAVRAPAAERLRLAYGHVQMREARAVHRHVLGTWPSQRERYGADVRARLDSADALTEADEILARTERERIRAEVVRWFTTADLVILPTTGCAPPRSEDPDRVDVDGQMHALRDVVLPHTVLANLTGLPALTVPMTVGADDSDWRGVQIIAAMGGDDLVLAAGALVTRQQDRSHDVPNQGVPV